MMALYTARRRQYKNPLLLVQARLKSAYATHAVPQEGKKEDFKNKNYVLAKNLNCRMT
jgi:hypothetical protein